MDHIPCWEEKLQTTGHRRQWQVLHGHAGSLWGKMWLRSVVPSKLMLNVVTPCTCARGKVIGLSVIGTKITRPDHLGIWETRTHNQSVEVVKKLASLCFKLFGKAHEHRRLHFLGYSYRHYPLQAMCFLLMLWNSKADKIIKLKCIVKFVANAWATFKPWSKHGVGAGSIPMWGIIKPMHYKMRMHCQYYQMQKHCQMRMHCQQFSNANGQCGQILAACWLSEVTPI